MFGSGGNRVGDWAEVRLANTIRLADAANGDSISWLTRDTALECEVVGDRKGADGGNEMYEADDLADGVGEPIQSDLQMQQMVIPDLRMQQMVIAYHD